MNTLFAASFGEVLPAVIVPVIIFMIPIVAILTKHQQKMAELIHGKGGSGGNQEVDALRREIAELKHLVHQQTLMLDEVVGNSRQLQSSTPPAMPERFEAGN